MVVTALKKSVFQNTSTQTSFPRFLPLCRAYLSLLLSSFFCSFFPDINPYSCNNRSQPARPINRNTPVTLIILMHSFEVFDLFSDLFACLPLAHVLNEKVNNNVDNPMDRKPNK